MPGKTSQELYDRVSADLEKFLSKAPVGKFDVTRDPAKKIVAAKGSMFSAQLACADGAIDLDVKLSLLAAPFRSKLDEGIDKWLSKSFPS